MKDVLFIDDQKFYREEFDLIMSESGYRIVTFRSPAEAAEAFDDFDWNNVAAVFVDYDYKRYTALDVGIAKQVREFSNQCKIILLSLQEDFKDQDIVDNTFDFVLSKSEMSRERLISLLES